MTPDRWQQISQLYHAALTRGGGDRAAFLAEACGGDEPLRREVESLLAQPASAQAFLDGEALAGAAQMVSDVGASVLTGRRLGAYQVQARLGAGGMGEVYRARDTKLGRDVAIKILPHVFTSDPERLARFEREARMLAALNHPNIGAIYGLEDADGIRALVLELVDGETLADRVARGPLPLKEALPIARQITEALDAAHEKGIIHRDLKPSNVALTRDRTVKVLDFGLAKASAGDGAGAAGSQAPTMSKGGTREGVVLGTAPYMSPEQARGQAVDKRTDIWAFGCVLYELLTGQVAFSGATIQDTIAAVLEHEPNWSALPAATPGNIRRLLERCLEKDPKRRLRDVGDARMELDDSLAEVTPVAARPRARWVPWAAAVVLASAALATASFVLLRRSSTPAPERTAQFTLSLVNLPGDYEPIGGTPTPSPDGQYLAFVAGGPNGGALSVWVRPLESVEATKLEGTEGTGPEGALIWAPDGRWIGFWADGKLKKIPPSGGIPQIIAELPGFQSAAWGPGGDIVYRPTNRAPLFRVSESGGSPTQVTRLDQALTENSHRYPQFLPDGRRFLFVSRCGERDNNALYIASLDSPEVKRVMPAQAQVLYAPPGTSGPGTLFYYRDGALVAQAFDTDRGTVAGDPVPVADKVFYSAPSISAGFWVSADGRVVIIRSAGAGDGRLAWVNREGEEAGVLGPPGNYTQPRISPDGARVAFSRPDDETGNRDVWYTEIVRGITARLTVDVANDWFPVWSPDGKQLLFGSDRGGGPELPSYLKKSMEPGRDESPVPDATDSPFDWSRDGRWISYGTDDLWIASSSGERKPFAFLATPAREGGGRFSPDGRWIAYVSNETGRDEVYVRPFGGAPTAADGKIQLSISGGDFPVWGPDGHELFYMSRDSSLYAVNTRNLGQSTTAPLPSRLFQACPGTQTVLPPLTGRTYGYAFDTHDGQRFLINCLAEPPGQYRVLMNWHRPQ
jgi:serine/threonine protein kinase/Tol biopolymer transport system component